MKHEHEKKEMKKEHEKFGKKSHGFSAKVGKGKKHEFGKEMASPAKH